MSKMRKIKIIGEISWESFEAFSDQLDELEFKSSKLIIIELASDGGDAKAALAFSAKIRRAHSTTSIIAYGNVASAAVIILASAKHRYISKDAWVMVHEENVGSALNDLELHAAEREVRQLRMLENQWSCLLASMTKTSAGKWEAMHKATTYLDAWECLELGLVDEVL